MSESSSVPTEREQLLNRLATLAYRRGDFTLASGRKSEHYVNCKPVSLGGSGLALISGAMLTRVEADALAVAGLTLGADPLVSGVAMAAADRGRELNALIVRKEAKGHGTGAWLEGPLPAPGHASPCWKTLSPQEAHPSRQFGSCATPATRWSGSSPSSTGKKGVTLR